jgi:hypothetical protein
MQNPRKSNIVVGLLQVRVDPWKSIHENGQLSTWIENSPDEVQIINIYGKTPSKLIRVLDIYHEKMRWSQLLQGPIHIADRYLTKFLSKIDNPKWTTESNKNVTNLFVEIPSAHLTLPIVEIALFKYFLKFTDANFLYMSNTSSYLNLNNLIRLVDNFPTSGVYGGTMIDFLDIKFASGANRILSRDTVQFLVDEFKNWDFQYIDDVSMGKMLASKKINEVLIPSLAFTSVEEIEATDKKLIKSNIHFRLKSGKSNSRNDIELMKHLHSVILS